LLYILYRIVRKASDKKAFEQKKGEVCSFPKNKIPRRWNSTYKDLEARGCLKEGWQAVMAESQ
jgi:hypothetical protein